MNPRKDAEFQNNLKTKIMFVFRETCFQKAGYKLKRLHVPGTLSFISLSQIISEKRFSQDPTFSGAISFYLSM
jgi:hypothetical protein